MRISDWSSDVCSSDLSQAGAPLNHRYVQPTQSEVERNAFHKWRCQATHFQKCRSICGVVTANIYMSDVVPFVATYRIVQIPCGKERDLSDRKSTRLNSSH